LYKISKYVTEQIFGMDLLIVKPAVNIWFYINRVKHILPHWLCNVNFDWTSWQYTFYTGIKSCLYNTKFKWLI